MGFAGALPVLMVLAGIMALALGIIALLTNGIKWARIPNRKFGAGVAGAALVLVMAGGAMAGTAGAVGTDALQNELAAAEPLQKDLASHIGEPCEFDYQVMTQGGASNYCDEIASGALVWVDQGTHDRSEAVLVSAREAEAKKKVEEAEAAKAKVTAEAEAEADEAVKAAEAAESRKSEEALASEVNEITEPAKTKVAEEVKSKAAAKPKKSETAAPAKPKQPAEAKAAKDKKAAEAKAAKKTADAKAALAAEKARQKKAAEKKSQDSPANTYYKNCTAARNAGAAPIYRGEPGYSRKLDRDGDGIGCEN